NVSHVSHETMQRERAIMRMRGIARGIFDTAVAIEGTLAQAYFESRDLSCVARMIDDIRFHAACPRGSRKDPDYCEQPAVVVAMRSYISNAVTAVQRIFLTRNGRKDGKGMMLGSAGGSGMKLQHLQNGSLHICAGLETGWPIIAQHHGPVGALGLRVLIQNFPVLDPDNELTVWADHDPVDPK